MKIEYALLAETSIVENLTQKLSVIGIFDEVLNPGIVSFHTVCRLVNYVENTQISFAVTIYDPEMKVIASSRFAEKKALGNKATNLRAIFPGVLFEKMGEHTVEFKVVTDDEEEVVETKKLIVKSEK